MQTQICGNRGLCTDECPHRPTCTKERIPAMIYAVIQDDLRLTAYGEAYVNDVGIVRAEALEEARQTTTPGQHEKFRPAIDYHLL